MEIRKAELEDLNEIIDIYRNAIDTMNSNNIPQWDEVYPNGTILKEDILAKQMYVGLIDNAIASVVVLNNEFDEQYNNGHWEYQNESFAVVHRLCVNPICQNQKVGRNTMLLVEKLLQKQGVQAIRLDAFSLNPYALKMYENLGYKKAGEANWRKGVFYLLEKKI